MMQIFVEGLEFVGLHGVYEEERRDGRRFLVHLTAHIDDTDLTYSPQHEVLTDTLDYRELAQIILDVGMGPSCLLVETLAECILTRVFEADARVLKADVTIRKFATGIPGQPECVGINMTRTRDWFEKRYVPRSAPHVRK